VLTTIHIRYVFNTRAVGDLLLEFFQYYTNFDFTNAGISVIEGSTVTKPDASVPLYIENPLERELNVAKNVQSVYLQEFQSACQSAYRCLEQSSTPASSKPWGLLNILQVGGDSDESNDVAYSEGGDSWAAETAEKDSSAASNVSDFSASSGFERSRLNFRVAEIFNESDSTVSESVLHKLH
jgi:hypothetical protein